MARKSTASMAEPQGWHLDKRIPVALIVTLLVYGGVGLMWAAATDERIEGQKQRIEKLENNSIEAAKSQTQIVDRLARIEEKSAAQVEILQRIEKRIGSR